MLKQTVCDWTSQSVCQLTWSEIKETTWPSQLFKTITRIQKKAWATAPQKVTWKYILSAIQSGASCRTWISQSGYGATPFYPITTGHPCHRLGSVLKASLKFTLRQEIYGLIWLDSLRLCPLQCICFYDRSRPQLRIQKTGKKSLFSGLFLPVAFYVWDFLGFSTLYIVTLWQFQDFFAGKGLNCALSGSDAVLNNGVSKNRSPKAAHTIGCWNHHCLELFQTKTT